MAEREKLIEEIKGLQKNQSNFSYNEEPSWVKGKRNILLKNPNLITILRYYEEVVIWNPK